MVGQRYQHEKNKIVVSKMFYKYMRYSLQYTSIYFTIPTPENATIHRFIWAIIDCCDTIKAIM